MSNKPASLVHLPFFIYGTLIPGQPNDHYLSEVIIYQEAAVFPNGLLYAFPTFPMLIEPADGNGMPIKGLIIEVDPSCYLETVQRLDQLEEYDATNPQESPYTREIRQVQTLTGKSIQVWTYIGKIELIPQAAFLIPSGDWVQYCIDSGAQDSMKSWWLAHGVDLLFGKLDQSD